MRIIAIVTASFIAITSASIANAACLWPANMPAKRAYMNVEGRVTSVSSRVQYDSAFGQGRKFIYHVQFVPGIKDRTSWTLLPTSTASNTIAVGDTFIWQYSDKLSKTYGQPRYHPIILHRLPNGKCDLIETDFCSATADIGF